MAENDDVKKIKVGKDGKFYLIQLVEDFKEIVECKKTDCKSSADKAKEWEAIAVKFNSKFPESLRTGNQLIRLWKNMKKCTKEEEYAKLRTYKSKTGGGPGPPVIDELFVKIASLFPQQIHSLNNLFDSDAPLDDPKVTDQWERMLVTNNTPSIEPGESSDVADLNLILAKTQAEEPPQVLPMYVASSVLDSTLIDASERTPPHALATFLFFH